MFDFIGENKLGCSICSYETVEMIQEMVDYLITIWQQASSVQIQFQVA